MKGIYMSKDYSKIILRLRVKLNVSQSELAKLLNVTFASVSRWENSHHEPSKISKVKITDLCLKNGIIIDEEDSL